MENMKKKYEIVNSNWIRIPNAPYGSRILKLNSITFLQSHDGGSKFMIYFNSGKDTIVQLDYEKTEEGEFKKDLALFEGMLTKL